MKSYAQTSLLSAALLATLALTYAGCSGGSFGGATESAAKDGKKKDVATTDDTGAGSPAGAGSKPVVAVEDSEDDKASEPAQVAGAFLACNMDATLDGTDSENVAFGCVLTRADKKIPLTDFEKVDWSLVDGKGAKIATKVYKMPESSAYHVGAPVPRALAAEARGEVAITVAGKAYAKKAAEPLPPTAQPEDDIEEGESEMGEGEGSDVIPSGSGSGSSTGSGSAAPVVLAEPNVIQIVEEGVIRIRDKSNDVIHLGDENLLLYRENNKGCAASAYGTKRVEKKLKMTLTVQADAKLVVKVKDVCGISSTDPRKAPRLKIREEGGDEDVLLYGPLQAGDVDFEEIALRKGAYRLTISSYEGGIPPIATTWDDFAFSRILLETDVDKVDVSEIKGDD